MTMKTIKTMLLFVGLIAAMIMPFSGMNYASGLEPKNNIVRGVVEHIPEPEIAQLDILTKRLETANISQSEATEIKAELKSLVEQMESRTKFNLNASEKAIMFSNYDKLNKQLQNDSDFKRLLETEIVGFGIDESTKGIFITVDPAFTTPENFDAYFKIFRKIVGDDIAIAIEVNERAKPTACTSITSDCDPLQGAVKLESESFNPCSLGFKATKAGETGFIMAGHCTSNSKRVYQPVEDFLGNNRVGVVTSTGWGDSFTYCDCAFVDLDTGVSIVDDVYSSIDLDSVGTVSAGTAVTMKGYVATTNTTVKTAAYTTTINGVTLAYHIQLNAAGTSGNSGGPVYNSSAKALYGIQSHNEGSYAIISNAAYLNFETGASFNFS